MAASVRRKDQYQWINILDFSKKIEILKHVVCSTSVNDPIFGARKYVFVNYK